MKPHIKWVGGKRQLLKEIEIRVPKNFNTYYEPFIGGGALFFHLKPQKAVIGDINYDLISSLNIIGCEHIKLMKKLDNYTIEHEKNPEKFYYNMRSLDRNENFKYISEIDRATRFMYLNKTSFNGMYRLNSKGENNVPWNKKEKVILYDKENINNINLFFNNNNIKIINGDFENVVNEAKKNDFIYFDPPYDILNESSFDKYNKDSFGKVGQKRLYECFASLHEKGCFVLLSNHNTEFIRKLYEEFTIDVVKANRKINSNAKKRGLVEEVLIYNYQIKGENMEKLEFEKIINNLKETIATPTYFSDFRKAIKNIEIFEDGLNLLNGLIGSKTPEIKLKKLIMEYEDKITRIIPILHAIRLFKTKNDVKLKFLNEKTKQLESLYFSENINCDELVEFCIETGILDLFKNKILTDTKSYVLGVEVGLDSNARKNRTGTFMEQIVSNILKKDNNIEMINEQISTKEIFNIYNVDLSSLGKNANKIFDFSFKLGKKLYLVECNFYGSQGSKLNETARSYKQLETEINQIENCNFIWITDGIGWRGARSNLKETYDNNKYVFILEHFKNKEISQLLKEEN